jgi:AcrR family transcriptional regulator
MKVSVPASPKRGRPRDPRRDEAILDAALDLVAEVGFDRMTVGDLATRAGVSKPTVYLRWPGGKAEVIASALQARRAAERQVDEDTGSLRGDLAAYVRTLIERLERNVHVAAGIACHLRTSPELMAVFREHAVSVERARVRAVLDRAVARGEIGDADAASPLFADVAGSVIHTRVLLTGEPVDGGFVDDLVDDVLLPILRHRKMLA